MVRPRKQRIEFDTRMVPDAAEQFFSRADGDSPAEKLEILNGLKAKLSELNEALRQRKESLATYEQSANEWGKTPGAQAGKGANGESFRLALNAFKAQKELVGKTQKEIKSQEDQIAVAQTAYDAAEKREAGKTPEQIQTEADRKAKREKERKDAESKRKQAEQATEAGLMSKLMTRKYLVIGGIALATLGAVIGGWYLLKKKK